MSILSNQPRLLFPPPFLSSRSVRRLRSARLAQEAEGAGGSLNKQGSTRITRGRRQAAFLFELNIGTVGEVLTSISSNLTTGNFQQHRFAIQPQGQPIACAQVQFNVATTGINEE
jgi:hypothetical protein